MDGFDPSIGVILLAATNRPEILDPALLRAGRFDRQVLVDRPDKKDRIAILEVHLKKAVLASDVDPEQVAELTPGFTGADLANLVNEAALLATRRGADSVHLTDFTAAVERMVAGLEKKNRLLIPKEREIAAYHELGHAIIAMAVPGQDPVHKTSIIPRGITDAENICRRIAIQTNADVKIDLMVVVDAIAAAGIDQLTITAVAREVADIFDKEKPALCNLPSR
jgi:cell division protease FtsH